MEIDKYCVNNYVRLKLKRNDTIINYFLNKSEEFQIKNKKRGNFILLKHIKSIAGREILKNNITHLQGDYLQLCVDSIAKDTFFISSKDTSYKYYIKK